MEPLFTLKTTITEEQYRRGVGSGINRIRFNILSVFFVGVAIFYAYQTYSLIAMRGVYADDTEIYILNGFISAMSLYFAVKFLRLPKKVIQNAVNQVAVKTGSTTLKSDLFFYENEIVNKAENSQNEGHVSYADVSEIRDFGDFLLFQSIRNVAVYLNKNQVPDYQGFQQFIIQKCPAAKWKTIY